MLTQTKGDIVGGAAPFWDDPADSKDNGTGESVGGAGVGRVPQARVTRSTISSPRPLVACESGVPSRGWVGLVSVTSTVTAPSECWRDTSKGLRVPHGVLSQLAHDQDDVIGSYPPFRGDRAREATGRAATSRAGHA